MKPERFRCDRGNTYWSHRHQRMINYAIVSLIIAPLTWITVLLYGMYIHSDHTLCIKCESVSGVMVTSEFIHQSVIGSTIIATIALAIGVNIRYHQIQKLLTSYNLDGHFKINDLIPMLSGIVLISLVLTTYYGIQTHKLMHQISAILCFIFMPIVQILHTMIILKIRRFEWRYFEKTLCNWIYHYFDTMYYVIFALLTTLGVLSFIFGYAVGYEEFETSFYPHLHPYYGEWVGIISMMAYYVMYSVTVYRDNKTIQLIEQRKIMPMQLCNEFAVV